MKRSPYEHGVSGVDEVYAKIIVNDLGGDVFI